MIYPIIINLHSLIITNHQSFEEEDQVNVRRPINTCPSVIRIVTDRRLWKTLNCQNPTKKLLHEHFVKRINQMIIVTRKKQFI